MTKLGSRKGGRAVQRARRHYRIRKKVWGTPERPRLVVYRSLRNIEGQIVDDEAARTVLGLSTLEKSLRDFAPEAGKSKRIEHARAAGKLLAAKAIEKGIQAVVFDRGGYKYHGRVKAF
jgi:large subunit ribosomal protein L18